MEMAGEARETSRHWGVGQTSTWVGGQAGPARAPKQTFGSETAAAAPGCVSASLVGTEPNLAPARFIAPLPPAPLPRSDQMTPSVTS